MAMSTLDHPRTDGQAQIESARIIQAVQPIAQIAIAIAHRGFFLRRLLGFQMGSQCFHHLLHRSSTQSLLLGPAPAIRLGAPTSHCRCAQIFTDMIKVAEKDALLAEDFPALTPYPIGSVSHRVDLAV